MNKKVKQKKLNQFNLNPPDYKKIVKLTKLVTNIIKSIYYFNIKMGISQKISK